MKTYTKSGKYSAREVWEDEPEYSCNRCKAVSGCYCLPLNNTPYAHSQKNLKPERPDFAVGQYWRTPNGGIDKVYAVDDVSVCFEHLNSPWGHSEFVNSDYCKSLTYLPDYEEKNQSDHIADTGKMVDDGKLVEAVIKAIMDVLERPDNWGVTPYTIIAREAIAAVRAYDAQNKGA